VQSLELHTNRVGVGEIGRGILGLLIAEYATGGKLGIGVWEEEARAD